MRTKLIKIGNSRGVRLPKPILEEVGLTDEIDLRIEDGTIILAPPAQPRSGWAEAAQRLRAADEDLLLDPPTPTRFDDEDWEW